MPRLPSASAARTSSARRSHPSRSGYGSLRLWPLSTSTSHTACHTVPQGHPPHTQVILHGVLSPESHPHRCRVDSPQIRNTPVEMYKSFAAWHAKAAQRKSRKDILRKTVSPKFRTGAHCLSRIFRCVSQVAGFRRALVLTKGIEKGDLIRRSPRGGPRLLSASPTRISSARRSHPSEVSHQTSERERIVFSESSDLFVGFPRSVPPCPARTYSARRSHPHLLSSLCDSQAWSRVIQKSINLKNEPFSAPLHISVRELFLN